MMRSVQRRMRRVGARWGFMFAVLLGVQAAALPAQALAAQALAGDPTPASWHPIGITVDITRHYPGVPLLAGRVSAVAVVPGAHPAELAGTLGGLWRETGGGRWHDVTASSWPATSVNSLAVDPADARIVYAGTGYDDVDSAIAQPGAGILKSSDGGLSWSPLPATEPLMRGYAVTGLAVDPHDDQTVVAAANNGLFRSTDAGAHWTEVLPLTGPYQGAPVEVHLAVDNATERLLAGVAQSHPFAAALGSTTLTTGHGVYVSSDAGATWKAYAVDSDTGAGEAVAPGIGTSGGVTYAYALDSTGDATSGIYTSRDGTSWTRMTGEDVATKFSIAQVAVDPEHPDTAYFAQAQGPFVYHFGSTRAAQLVARDASSPAFGDYRALAFGPSVNDPAHEALYAGHDGGTVFYDFGSRSYTSNEAGLVSGMEFYVAAQSSDYAFVGSQDLGVQLQTGAAVAQEAYHADGYGVIIDRARPSHVLASVNASGLPVKYVFSNDAGGRWADVPLVPRPSDLFPVRAVQAQGDPRVMILPDADAPSLYVSSDEGATWVERPLHAANGQPVTSVRAAVLGSSTTPVIFVGTLDGRILRSADLGASWTALPMTFPHAVNDLAIDPSGQRLYAGLGAYVSWDYAGGRVPGDVYESTDGGATWKEIGQSLQSSVNALVLSGSTLLAATDSGVERYGAGGWATAGEGLPNVRVNDLVLSADASAFFAATVGRGTWETFLPAPTPRLAQARLVRAQIAIVTGNIDTQGNAVSWQFQFSAGGRLPQATPLQVIPAGRTGPIGISWPLSHLRPATAYHYRLLVTATLPGATVPFLRRSATGTFRTAGYGRLVLPSRRLDVRRGAVIVPLRCVSELPCQGTFSIVTHGPAPRHRAAPTLVCTRSSQTSFAIAAGSTVRERVGLLASCLGLIRGARSHTISAKLSSRPRSGQAGLIESVRLRLA